MKTLLVAVFVCCASAAFGQANGVAVSAEVSPLQMMGHPQQAAPHALAQERPIVGGTQDTYSYAQGERPLWEFGPVKQEPALGDVARAYRKEKSTGKKAEIVFEKQGS
jgi:hypothetical protein